jgi:hypothetical protein
LTLMLMMKKKEGLKLKSLLTRPNLFLIIRIKREGRRGIVIPVPVWILEELFNTLADLSWLGEITVFRLGKSFIGNSKAKHAYEKFIDLSPSKALETFREVIGELRKHGRFRMLEVEDGKNKIYIDLY